MKNTQRGLLVRHLTKEEINHAISDAQKADETRLVRRLCFVSNLYQGDTRVEAGRRVVDREIPTRRWARAWNKGGVEGLRPHFGGGRPPKLTPGQWNELCDLLEESQPWTPRQIHALIEGRYGVHTIQPIIPMAVDRLLRADGQSVITYKTELVKETIVKALEEVHEQNSPDRILLVADNYGSHHAHFTQNRADELGTEFVFISPYSPTLNTVEPLWKDFERELSPEIFADKTTSVSSSPRYFSA